MADNTSGDNPDLKPEELDQVAGGAFHGGLESSVEIGSIHPDVNPTKTQVGISEACLNPQPLPP